MMIQNEQTAMLFLNRLHVRKYGNFLTDICREH